MAENSRGKLENGSIRSGDSLEFPGLGEFELGETIGNSSGGREVIEVEPVSDHHGNPVVLKHENKGEEQNVQNLNEALVFLESLQRGEIFTPPVYGGKNDFEYLIVSRCEHIETGDDVIPENWHDYDDTEYGTFNGQTVVMDPDMLYPEDGWNLYDPMNSENIEHRDNYIIVNI